MTFTPEQWAQRCKGVGASEVPIIMGLSNWSNIHDLWLQKTGRQGPDEDNDYTEFGRIMEPVLVERYRRRIESDLRIEPNDESRSFGPHAWEFATPDALVWHSGGALDRVADMKTASEYKIDQWGADCTADVPDMYAVQLQWQMHCCTVDRGDIMALVGRSFRLYHLERNQNIIDLCREHVAAFWRLVETDTPPRPDGTEAAKKTLFARFQESNGVRVATVDEASLIEELGLLKAELAGIEKRHGMVEQKLCEAVGDMKTITSPVGRFTWYRNKGKSSTDWKAIVEEAGIAPEVVQKHTKAGSPYRVPRFTGANNGK